MGWLRRLVTGAGGEKERKGRPKEAWDASVRASPHTVSQIATLTSIYMRVEQTHSNV